MRVYIHRRREFRVSSAYGYSEITGTVLRAIGPCHRERASCERGQGSLGTRFVFVGRATERYTGLTFNNNVSSLFITWRYDIFCTRFAIVLTKPLHYTLFYPTDWSLSRSVFLFFSSIFVSLFHLSIFYAPTFLSFLLRFLFHLVL